MPTDDVAWPPIGPVIPVNGRAAELPDDRAHAYRGGRLHPEGHPMADRQPPSNIPSVEESMARLCGRGWAVECREIPRNGRPVWLVGARRGRNAIQATGATLSAALSFAARRAAIVDARDGERRSGVWLTTTEPIAGQSPAGGRAPRRSDADGDVAPALRIYPTPSAN